MSPGNRNVLVGLTVLGGLIGFVGMLLKFSGGATQFFRGGQQVQVEFRCDRADGLADGSAVTYRGVTVGRITGIRRGSNSRDILINALIDNTPPLPANVTGRIRTVSMISGIASIAMDLVGGPNATAQGTLSEGQKIDVIYVGSELLPPEFSQDLKGVGDYVNDPKIGADLRASLENIRHISEKISKFTDRLDGIGDQASGAITDARTTVQDAKTDVEKLSRQVDDRMLEVAKALESVNSIITKVNTGQGTAGQLLNDPRLYQSLVDNSRELNATILDLKRLIEQWEQEGVTLKLK
jgi:phospholipid/cholesterol/gamma-HCH transport system substrate-binding protein